jgi:hypothetical protein
MVAMLSVTSLCLGATLAGYAPRAGKRVAAFETCGGSFLLVGLVLIGGCLPLFR